MTLIVSIILTGISIGLLAIYGADVAAGGVTGDGFLGSDHMARGIGLGLPAVILPIIAFFISLKKPSIILGIMLAVSGILIVGGGAFLIAMTDPIEAQEAGRNILSEAGPLIGIGLVIIGFGAVKLIKFR